MAARILLTNLGTKLVAVSARGPSSDVTVGAGAAADIALAYQPAPVGRILQALSLKSIEGLPDGLALVQFKADEGGVTIRMLNTTGADVTVPANSITASVLAEAL